MSFQTIGWFGADCYTSTENIVFPQVPTQMPNMVVWKFWNPNLNPQPTDLPAGYQGNFPLELAMKIFWESATITMNASLTSTEGNFTISSSISAAINWGGFDDQVTAQVGFPYLENLRVGIGTAKEMLCHINSDNQLQPNPMPLYNSSHTVLRRQRQLGVRTRPNLPPEPYGDRWIIAINPRPYIWIPDNVNIPIEIYAPFYFEYQHWGIGPNGIGTTMQTGSPQFPLYGNAQINTPWGSIQNPMYKGPSSTSGSMTINITGTDPLTRYA